jgi:hypothetical protein
MRLLAKARSMRWICALLLVGFSMQTALAAAHPPVPIASSVVHEQPMDDDAHESHDPASCSFCRILSFFEHGLSVPPLCGPLVAEAPRAGLEVLPAPRAERFFDQPTSRAPPHSQSA